jgi:hypothetical protein
MQSYEQYIVPESLSKRHPYLQEDFTSEINPKQVNEHSNLSPNQIPLNLDNTSSI